MGNLGPAVGLTLFALLLLIVAVVGTGLSKRVLFLAFAYAVICGLALWLGINW